MPKPGRMLIIEEVEGGFILTACEKRRDSPVARAVAATLDGVVQSVRAAFATSPDPPLLTGAVYRQDGG